MDPLLTSIPINSLVLIPGDNRLRYINTIFTLPKKVQDILFSDDTGAYIRGLGKSYDVDITITANIALVILFITIGEKTLVQLPTILSTELKIPSDQAQKMALEIEKDIFGPVQAELDEFLKNQKKEATPAIAATPSTSSSHEDEKPRTAPPTRTSPNPSFVRRGNAAQPRNILDLKELNAGKKQVALPAKPKQQSLPSRTAHATTPLSASPSPLPRTARSVASPLPERERGTTPAIKFPLPPRTPVRPTPPTPPTKPLRLA